MRETIFSQFFFFSDAPRTKAKSLDRACLDDFLRFRERYRVSRFCIKRKKKIATGIEFDAKSTLKNSKNAEKCHIFVLGSRTKIIVSFSFAHYVATYQRILKIPSRHRAVQRRRRRRRGKRALELNRVKCARHRDVNKIEKKKKHCSLRGDC